MRHNNLKTIHMENSWVMTVYNGFISAIQI